jgi:tRNA threonylcarbamoyladenosine biosynthesis protein TsaB
MRLLALDTSLARCSVALGEAGRLRAARGVPLAQGHAERLLPMVQAALADAGWRYPDLDALAVTVGPGSFTGVRIGLAAIRGMALALRRPVIGLPTLQVLAAQARARPEETVLALIDARRSEIYAQAFDAGLRPLQGPSLWPLDALPRMLPPGPLVAVGSGILVAGERLGAARRAVPATAPEAAAMIGIVHRLGLTGGAPPAPVYLRRPDARLPAQR